MPTFSGIAAAAAAAAVVLTVVSYYCTHTVHRTFDSTSLNGEKGMCNSARTANMCDSASDFIGITCNTMTACYYSLPPFHLLSFINICSLFNSEKKMGRHTSVQYLSAISLNRQKVVCNRSIVKKKRVFPSKKREEKAIPLFSI